MFVGVLNCSFFKKSFYILCFLFLNESKNLFYKGSNGVCNQYFIDFNLEENWKSLRYSVTKWPFTHGLTYVKYYYLSSLSNWIDELRFYSNKLNEWIKLICYLVVNFPAFSSSMLRWAFSLVAQWWKKPASLM